MLQAACLSCLQHRIVGENGINSPQRIKNRHGILPQTAKHKQIFRSYHARHTIYCLNYVYGLLYGEVWRTVAKAGLDPYFGLVHGSARDQGSLVFDLIEEFRAPFGDRIVISLLGRVFRPEAGRHGFLRTRSKRQLVRSFAKRWAKPIRHLSRDLTPAKLLANQADSLASVFRREGSYHPFRMRW